MSDTSAGLRGSCGILGALRWGSARHVEEAVVPVLHVVQHLLRLRQLLLRGLVHRVQHGDLLHEQVPLPLQSIPFLAEQLEFLGSNILLLRGAALWCCVLLHVCGELLRRSM